jgi:hypothetical protein
MTGDIDTPGEEDQVEKIPAEDVSDEDVVLNTDVTDVGGSTAEIKVDELVAKIDLTDAEEAARKREIQLKLDALNEGRDDDFGSTYNFDLDKDL